VIRAVLVLADSLIEGQCYRMSLLSAADNRGDFLYDLSDRGVSGMVGVSSGARVSSAAAALSDSRRLDEPMLIAGSSPGMDTVSLCRPPLPECATAADAVESFREGSASWSVNNPAAPMVRVADWNTAAALPGGFRDRRTYRRVDISKKPAICSRSCGKLMGSVAK